MTDDDMKTAILQHYARARPTWTNTHITLFQPESLSGRAFAVVKSDEMEDGEICLAKPTGEVVTYQQPFEREKVCPDCGQLALTDASEGVLFRAIGGILTPWGIANFVKNYIRNAAVLVSGEYRPYGHLLKCQSCQTFACICGCCQYVWKIASRPDMDDRVDCPRCFTKNQVAGSPKIGY
jgi:hypothetical protein